MFAEDKRLTRSKDMAPVCGLNIGLVGQIHLTDPHLLRCFSIVSEDEVMSSQVQCPKKRRAGLCTCNPLDLWGGDS